MDFECDCAGCNNDDAPEMHEVCACFACHDALCHYGAEQQWATDCDWCADEMRQQKAEALYDAVRHGDIPLKTGEH